MYVFIFRCVVMLLCCAGTDHTMRYLIRISVEGRKERELTNNDTPTDSADVTSELFEHPIQTFGTTKK